MYDALVLISFGGPEGPDDVIPFLENVTRGRGVPRARLEAVAEHYLHFGGVSPINAQNRALIEALRVELTAHGVDLPIYWGNRNWEPYLTDTVAAMAAGGVRRALAIVTSAYASYSACRQYQDDIARAREAVGEGAPVIDRVRHFFNHPGFVQANIDAVRSCLVDLPDARIVYTAHSIPMSMAESSGPSGGAYEAQLAEAAQLVTDAVAPGADFDLVWQSRSGPPRVPWLEPDINDQLEKLAAAGVGSVVVSPIGFVSDHMEVVWDLDVEAAQTAERLGMGYRRAASAGTHPAFVAGLRELVQERLDPTCPRRALGRLGPAHDVCPVGCCSPR